MLIYLENFSEHMEDGRARLLYTFQIKKGPHPCPSKGGLIKERRPKFICVWQRAATPKMFRCFQDDFAQNNVIYCNFSKMARGRRNFVNVNSFRADFDCGPSPKLYQRVGSSSPPSFVKSSGGIVKTREGGGAESWVQHCLDTIYIYMYMYM